MKIALLGATGTIGSAYLQRALADGHDVRALVRDATSLTPACDLTVLSGDSRDLGAVAGVVADSDAVVSAVGPRANTADAVALLASTATNVIAAMRTYGVSRVVFVAGAGVALPGERRTLGQNVARTEPLPRKRVGLDGDPTAPRRARPAQRSGSPRL